MRQSYLLIFYFLSCHKSVVSDLLQTLIYFHKLCSSTSVMWHYLPPASTAVSKTPLHLFHSFLTAVHLFGETESFQTRSSEMNLAPGLQTSQKSNPCQNHFPLTGISPNQQKPLHLSEQGFWDGGDLSIYFAYISLCICCFFHGCPGGKMCSPLVGWLVRSKLSLLTVRQLPATLYIGGIYLYLVPKSRICTQ